MHILGLIFHGTMQSWGGVNMAEINRNSPKNTEMSPTKSAILGLLRSSLGTERGEDDTDNLKSLHILTRIDCPGLLARDYNVAERIHHGFRAGATKEIPRYNLQDATFITLVCSLDEALIQKLDDALQNPKWAPFIGRRAHVPTLPVLLGKTEHPEPANFLEELPVFWRKQEPESKKVTIVGTNLSKQNSTQFFFFDDPLSWDMKDRNYGMSEYEKYSLDCTKPEKIGSTLEQYGQLIESFK